MNKTDAQSKAIHAKAGKKEHSELVKRFKKGEVGGREVFESAMKHKIKPKYNTDYPL